MARSISPTVPSNSDIQDELRRRLFPTISAAELANRIRNVLASFGTKRPRIEVVAERLAKEFGPRFVGRSNALEALIKYRWKELKVLVDVAAWEAVRVEILPMARRDRKIRAKPRTQEERLRLIKAAKNRYEHERSAPTNHVGLIEREFSENSPFWLLALVHQEPPSGPCLDDIFRGDAVRMSNGMYSLQSLFGLPRKKLSAAAPGTRRGREFFYDYRAVLRCMEALLKCSGEDSPWLADSSRRRTVLTGILFRAKQEAKREIAAEFEKKLIPHLS